MQGSEPSDSAGVGIVHPGAPERLIGTCSTLHVTRAKLRELEIGFEPQATKLSTDQLAKRRDRPEQ